MHVVLAGGGSAGHVEPALAVADALRREDPEVGITLLGTARGLETRLVPARGYDLALIPPVPLPRAATPRLLAVPGRLLAAVAAAVRLLDRVVADVVVGFGGYVALPAYLAAWQRQLGLVVHEANARPGLANRVGARLTRHVAAATPDCPLPHAAYVGIPLRPAVARLDRPARRAEARRHFGLHPQRPTLLVFGGSQGARSLNRAAVAAAPALAAAGVQVLHAVGPANVGCVPVPASPRAAPGNGDANGDGDRSADGPPYRVVPYLERMDLAYAAADVALCRAGALTCAELAAVGLPAAYVPLPIGNGEQRLNAQPVVRAGGGLLVDDAALSADWIRDHLVPLLADPARVRAMGEAARRFGRRDADRALVRMVHVAAAGSRAAHRRGR